MTVRGRREWLRTVAVATAGAVGAQLIDHANGQSKRGDASPKTSVPLALKDYQPKSMLHVSTTSVPKSRFPNIDFHTHLSWIDRKGRSDVVHHAATPSEILRVMDAK